jgi:hypothetical protein
VGGVRDLIGAGVRRLDGWCEPHFRLTRPLYVADPAAAAGAGVWSAQEWQRHRRAATAPFEAHADRCAGDAQYARYLVAIHEAKLRAVLALADTFDFGPYRRVLELGCGDMAQAFVLCGRLPGLAYTATDFDAGVIADCARLPLLAGIDKRVFDVTGPDLGLLDGHDLALSWSLEFSLDDAQLTRLFAACKAHAVPWLLCTHTGIGPLRFWLEAPRASRQRRYAREPGWRLHGWLRSAGQIATLAGAAGIALAWRARLANHTALLFEP